jgi:hypothetical protein
VPFHNVNYQQMLNILGSGVDEPALCGGTPPDSPRAVSQC